MHVRTLDPRATYELLQVIDSRAVPAGAQRCSHALKAAGNHDSSPNIAEKRDDFQLN